ncbi:hypothetical protein [Hyalangium minutum]|uniref:Lipoprotein n=1 Tax=Hyalangium minutum TaxID=394096 RepID=A0A085W8G6_9BACT|nr:hypothetical protein [Hyalangium minutum]KFE63979.1 hypothetical protein DB31_2391 [Hyalangium minutum]
MFKKAMTGLFMAMVLSPAAALAENLLSNCTPGDIRQCPRTTDPNCYQECTSFGNWTTTCFCESPATEDEQASRQGDESSRLCSTAKPATQQTESRAN